MFSVTLEIPFSPLCMWAWEVVLQKWVVLSHLETLAALDPWGQVYPNPSSLEKLFSEGFQAQQEQRWVRMGQDYSRLVANDEKGLCLMPLTSWFPQATLQNRPPPGRLDQCPVFKGKWMVCVRRALWTLSDGFTSSHRGLFLWRCPPPRQTWLAAEQRVSIWKFTACLSWPLQMPQVQPVQQHVPPHAASSAKSWEKAGGTFLPASALKQSASFWEERGLCWWDHSWGKFQVAKMSHYQNGREFCWLLVLSTPSI